jgi:cobalamin biosynthesis protein CbiD
MMKFESKDGMGQGAAAAAAAAAAAEGSIRDSLGITLH